MQVIKVSKSLKSQRLKIGLIKLKYSIMKDYLKSWKQLQMKATTKYVLKGASLTILSAAFALFGLVVASTQNLVAGAFIVIGSSVFWGYACLLSGIVELRQKRSSS
jgi:hypothetical protein